jgi:hypothetical protein
LWAYQKHNLPFDINDIKTMLYSLFSRYRIDSSVDPSILNWHKEILGQLSTERPEILNLKNVVTNLYNLIKEDF